MEILQSGQSMWLAAFAMSAGFYAVVVFWLGHFSPEVKEELTLWLWGERQFEWAAMFSRSFDAFYGKKHVSWRCFIRSSLVSIAAVVFLTYIFSLSNSAENMPAVRHPYVMLGLFFILGAIINVVPDYLSLIETRWLLRKFETVHGFRWQCLFVLADLVFTATIIIVSLRIFEYSLVLGVDDAPTSIIELVAFFSIFSIFFYSSFSSSLWVLAFFLSFGFVKFFNWVGVSKYLDVEHNPEKQIALAGSIIIFIGLIGILSLTQNDPKTNVSRLDRALCQVFPQSTCDYIARQATDEALAAAYRKRACLHEPRSHGYCYSAVSEFKALLSEGDRVVMLEKGCELADFSACRSLAQHYRKQGELASAIRIYESSCNQVRHHIYMDDGCVPLGELYLYTIKEYEKALPYFSLACDKNKEKGCDRASYIYRFHLKDDERALAFYDRANTLLAQGCDAGNALDCGWLAARYEKKSGLRFDAQKASALYERQYSLYTNKCLQYDRGFSCKKAADMIVKGRVVAKEEAAVFYQRACDLGEATACGLINGNQVQQ